MLTREQLEAFCLKEAIVYLKETRRGRAMGRPWSRGNYTYATNGQVIIRVPRIDDVEENVDAYPAESYDEGMDAEHRGLIRIPEPGICMVCEGEGEVTLLDCHECLGGGEVTVSSEFNDYMVQCKTCSGLGYTWGAGRRCYHCKGRGRSYDERRVKVGRHFFGAESLMLISGLPGDVRIDMPPRRFPVITFEGGKGAVPESLGATVSTFVFEGGKGVIIAFKEP